MINIGLTARHGIVQEMTMFPPECIRYSFVDHIPNSLLKHPVLYYDSQEHDIIEAFDFPCFTKNRWMLQLYNATGLGTFTIANDYYSRQTRMEIIKKLLLKDNFKRLIIGSKAGFESCPSLGL